MKEKIDDSKKIQKPKLHFITYLKSSSSSSYKRQIDEPIV